MSRYLPVIKTVILIILVVGIALSLIFRPDDDTKGFPDAIWGKPVVFEDDSVMPHSGIEQVVSDGQRVYVLYDSEKGVVQVYDCGGTYLHSMRLYKHMNGAFSMPAEGDMLYIKDYHGDIYAFKNGEFSEFLRNEAADAIKEEIPHSIFEQNTQGYEVRSGSVWRIDGDTQTCIISRPAQTGIYQNNMNNLLPIFACIALALVYWYFQKKRL